LNIPKRIGTDSGPLMLQGDHGRVSFRNIKIKPLAEKSSP
jgi:hypothetical protein